MIKSLNIYAFLVLLLAVLSCQNTAQRDKLSSPPFQRDLDKILESGKLVAMVDNSSTSYFVYRGEPMGFEYELISKFADHLGVDLEIKLIDDLDFMLEELNEGTGDLIAANLTVTKERSQIVTFSEEILSSKQVLVQHKSGNRKLIKKATDLEDSVVHVRRNSSFYERLENLSEEIGADIIVEEVPGSMTVEKLIEKVDAGEINYTIADEHIAKINKAYFQHIDINTAISLDQSVAWAVRRNSEMLQDIMNNWLKRFKKTLDFRMIYLKYYGNTKLFTSRLKSELFTSKSGTLSPFDAIVKKEAEALGWDWRLLVSMIYQESGFDHYSRSWAGAYGLMQLMPATAASFGIDSTAGPAENIKAGVKYLDWLSKEFESRVTDSLERRKFILAAYNVGLGHVFDAMRLADKYDLDPKVWEGNVAEMLLNKAQPTYYKDEVVYYGYCRGSEPYAYVEEIMDRYAHYKNITSRSNEQLTLK